MADKEFPYGYLKMEEEIINWIKLLMKDYQHRHQHNILVIKISYTFYMNNQILNKRIQSKFYQNNSSKI